MTTSLRRGLRRGPGRGERRGEMWLALAVCSLLLFLACAGCAVVMLGFHVVLLHARVDVALLVCGALVFQTKYYCRYLLMRVIILYNATHCKLST